MVCLAELPPNRKIFNGIAALKLAQTRIHESIKVQGLTFVEAIRNVWSSAHQAIRQVNSLPVDYCYPVIQQMRDHWQQMHQAAKMGDEQNAQSHYQAICEDLSRFEEPSQIDFQSTDLIVVSDLVPDELVLGQVQNAVRSSEYVEICALYRAIEKGETSLQVKGDPEFRSRVLKDIKMLLTRPSGRALIRQLVNQPKPIEIVEGKEHLVFTGKLTITMTYKLNDFLCVQDGASKYLQRYPSFILLGHEMIHIKHHLEGSLLVGKGNLSNKSFSNCEEARTITGQSLSSEALDIGDDPINENQLRREFSISERYGHFGGAYFYDFPEGPDYWVLFKDTLRLNWEEMSPDVKKVLFLKAIGSGKIEAIDLFIELSQCDFMTLLHQYVPQIPADCMQGILTYLSAKDDSEIVAHWLSDLTTKQSLSLNIYAITLSVKNTPALAQSIWNALTQAQKERALLECVYRHDSIDIPIFRALNQNDLGNLITKSFLSQFTLEMKYRLVQYAQAEGAPEIVRMLGKELQEEFQKALMQENWNEITHFRESSKGHFNSDEIGFLIGENPSVELMSKLVKYALTTGRTSIACSLGKAIPLARKQTLLKEALKKEDWETVSMLRELQDGDLPSIMDRSLSVSKLSRLVTYAQKIGDYRIPEWMKQISVFKRIALVFKGNL